MKPRWMGWALGLFLVGAKVWGQAPAVDSILPPDHLLENLPWMGDDGKIEGKGLFDFEDIRGAGQKDLILVCRQSVPVNEMDKPHSQTMILCFFDPAQKKYVKAFEDEGGTIQWIKLVKNESGKAPFLFLQRDDLKGNQVLKGFSYLSGSIKPVLQASEPQLFTGFATGPDGVEVLCSSKGTPKDKGDAEQVYDWDLMKDQFLEAPTPVVASAAVVKPAPVAAVAAVSAPKGHLSKNGWWDEPLQVDASVARLKTELVPDLIKKGQIAVLGQKAKAFFAELQKKGTDAKTIAGAKSTYYAAVASAVLESGDAKGGAYYLKTALQLQSDNPDALALKAKMK